MTYTNLGTAETLGELAALIEEIIKEYGENATWSGYDDGSLYVYGNGKQGYIDSE